MSTTQAFNKSHEVNDVVAKIMKLHKCSTCSIRCRAVAQPHSVFARLHRWHLTWWPGWKIYQAEARARNANPAPRA